MFGEETWDNQNDSYTPEIRTPVAQYIHCSSTVRNRGIRTIKLENSTSEAGGLKFSQKYIAAWIVLLRLIHSVSWRRRPSFLELRETRRWYSFWYVRRQVLVGKRWITLGNAARKCESLTVCLRTSFHPATHPSLRTHIIVVPATSYADVWAKLVWWRFPYSWIFMWWPSQTEGSSWQHSACFCMVWEQHILNRRNSVDLLWSFRMPE